MSDFVGPSYRLGDVQAACQRTVNMYVQRVGTPEKAQFILRAFPGFSATPFGEFEAPPAEITIPPVTINFEGLTGLIDGNPVGTSYVSSLGVEFLNGSLLEQAQTIPDEPFPAGGDWCCYGTSIIRLTIDTSRALNKFNAVSFAAYVVSAQSMKLFGTDKNGGTETLLRTIDFSASSGSLLWSANGPFVVGTGLTLGIVDKIITKIEWQTAPGGQGFAIDNIVLSKVGTLTL
jgi:hypothetical protein